MDNFSFYVLTDPHYYEPSLGAVGEEYENRSITSTRCIGETSSFFKSAKNIIMSDSETDTVIMPGDLTSDGEKESHKSFIKELDGMALKGKKIFVLTAAHDYNENAVGYNENGRYPVEGTKREELHGLYINYGFGSAVDVYEHDNLSYVADLNKNVRMLALNCDGDGAGLKGGFTARQLNWAKEQIKKAKNDGKYIFAVTHYPLIPGNPVFSLIGDAKLKDWQNTAEFLADAGLDLIFTGHMHMQSVKTYTSKNGNKITDVCTSSTCAVPGAIRKITLFPDGKIKTETKYIETADIDLNGRTVREFFNYRMLNLIDTAVYNMSYDYEAFMKRISAKPVKILKPVVARVGKTINTLTFGKAGKFLFIKTDSKIKDKLIKDFIYDCILHIFSGDSPYIRGTGEYDFVAGLTKRCRPILYFTDKKLKNTYYGNTCNFIFEVIGNPMQNDNNGIINLKQGE